MADLRGEEGQMLPALLMLMLGIVGIGVIAVQIGKATVLRSDAQTAADAAALAGARDVRNQLARQWATTGTSDLSLISVAEVRSAAADYAARNDGRLTDIKVDGADVRAWVDTERTQGKGAPDREDKRGEAKARARVSLVYSPGVDAGNIGPPVSTSFKAISDDEWKQLDKRLNHHPPQCSSDPSQSDLYMLGRLLQQHGAVILGNAELGSPPSPGAHEAGGWHYKCGDSGALDVNFDSTGREAQILDSILAPVQKLGFRTIWRAPGHFDHMHIDTANGPAIGVGGGTGGAAGALEDSLLDVRLIDWDAPSPTGFAGGFLGDPGGIPFGPPDPQVAAVACAVLDRLGASPKARLALWEALIVESGVKNLTWGDATSVGPLQLLDIHGSVAHRRDVPWVLSTFLTQGYAGRGGAMSIARNHPELTAGLVAQWVQGSARPWAYDQRQSQAIALNRQFCGGEGLS